jgi:antitoxin component YwqK of YwqJK toxin-antitoxin module
MILPSKTLSTLLATSALLILLSSCQRTRSEQGFHENGNLMYEITFKGSAKHGPSIYYFNDGRKEIEYHYINDVLEGKVTRWYFNGNIEFEEHYAGNELDGPSRYNFITGKISEEKHYRNGELDGAYKVYWENGVVKISGQHALGYYQGRWEYFNEQGVKVGEANFERGSGKMLAYHQNGRVSREVNYLENEKHGWEITLSESGDTLQQQYYEFGTLTGEVLRK